MVTVPHATNRITYIYGLSDPVNGIRYIGQSVNPNLRLIHHKVFARNDKHTPKGIWFNANMDKITIVILETCFVSDALEREKYWIKHYLDNGTTLYNKAYGNYDDTFYHNSRFQ